MVIKLKIIIPHPPLQPYNSKNTDLNYCSFYSFVNCILKKNFIRFI